MLTRGQTEQIDAQAEMEHRNRIDQHLRRVTLNTPHANPEAQQAIVMTSSPGLDATPKTPTTAEPKAKVTPEPEVKAEPKTEPEVKPAPQTSRRDTTRRETMGHDG